MTSQRLLRSPVRYGLYVGLAAVSAGFASIGLWLVVA
jgi:hypothetical protein